MLGNVALSLDTYIGAIYPYGPKQLVIVSQQPFAVAKRSEDDQLQGGRSAGTGAY